MKIGTAEIIDFNRAKTQTAGSGGGEDHFAGMKLGTIFCCAINGSSSSFIDEYMLCSKAGVTVLLQNAHNGRFERHIGHKFWKQNTLVQILHIPEEKEEQDGKSV